jgi:ribosomal protein L21E
MASVDGNNGSKWDKNFVVALLSLLVSFILGALALLFTVATPELRQRLGLEEIKPVPPAPEAVTKQPLPQPAHQQIHTDQAVSHSDRFAYVLYENSPQFVETADATLSFAFNEFKKEAIVSLTIAPAGRESSNHAVWTGDSAEFSSAAGDFLVSILNVDVDEKKIAVQVSKIQ